jgi:hypothetical protein
MRLLITITCIIALAGNLATAQDLADQLKKVGTQNVQNYVTPIFNGWAADLNSGIYHSADLHSVLGFDIGVKIGFALVTDEDKKYDFLTPDSIGYGGMQLHAGVDYDAVVRGVPTSVGDNDANNHYYVRVLPGSSIYTAFHAAHPNDALFEIPKGFNLPVIPMFIPQASIGLPFGIEIIGRFIPTISAGDAGKFNYMGFGLRYDIDQLIPMCPVDIAIHFMTQKMNFKSKGDVDIFEATGTAFGAEISKKILLLTIYGGFQIEKATFTLAPIDGTFETPDGTITRFTIPETTYEGKNKSRFTLGARVLLGVANIHVDYSVAKSPVVALGIGISFR